MDQVLTGTVHGNTIVLDGPLSVPDGEIVEVVVRNPRPQSTLDQVAVDPTNDSPPSWWTPDDDRILDEIYQARKHSTRPEITE